MPPYIKLRGEFLGVHTVREAEIDRTGGIERGDLIISKSSSKLPSCPGIARTYARR